MAVDTAPLVRAIETRRVRHITAGKKGTALSVAGASLHLPLWIWTLSREAGPARASR